RFSHEPLSLKSWPPRYEGNHSMNQETVRHLAASLLSGCWDRTTIRLNPHQAANLGASLIAASRAAHNNTAVNA
ncbi:hypothetical protein V6U90_32755, partial [Micromonospora sp. CPCC 206060]|uniref:hypothetical protein n=1 Tax=Micromonospora sp. CPCC 206060 TaxID=3122406 RepID=UPI002FF09B37